MNEVIVNGRFLGRAGTGVERFATQMLLALDDAIARHSPLAKDMRFRILHPRGVKPSIELANIPLEAVGRFDGHLWEQVELPLHSGNRFLINLCNTAPAFRRRQMVIIHDAATFSAPQGFTRSFRLFYRLLLKQIVRQSEAVSTVSSFSSAEIIKWIGTPRGSIKVVSEGSDHATATPADESVLETHQLRARPFVLAVGSRHPNKNLKLILRAGRLLKDPPFDIVIVGGRNSAVFQAEKGDVAYPLPPFVKQLGYVTDEELTALYREAMCLVFPSLYEGFGLPPLEAMALGCPVIAADSASLPEVLGDAARYIDPLDAESLVSALMELAGDSALRATLSRRGLQRAGGFRWRDSADRLLADLRGRHGLDAAPAPPRHPPAGLRQST